MTARRPISLLAAVLLAAVAWLAPMPSAVAIPETWVVSVYTYDAPVYDAPEHYTAPERGPPLRGYADTTYDAADRSHGTSARSAGLSTPANTTHATLAVPAPAADATTTTGSQVVGAVGVLSLLDRWQVAANSVRTPEKLASIASRIKNAPDVHVNQLKNQVIAVGTDADGMLVAASNTSSSLTRGQRATMDELGVLRAPSRTVSGDALHAEENLLGAMPNPTGIGTSALDPCPGQCFPLLSRLGIPWATAP